MSLEWTDEYGFKIDNIIVHGEDVLGSLQRDFDGNYVYSYVEPSTGEQHTVTTSNREEMLKQPSITPQLASLV